MKNILGISAFYHDSAACIIISGEIVACAQEERFNRCKNTSEFPENAIKYCLEEAGLVLNDLDALVFYDKPFLKFERLLQTYYSFAPKGLSSFLKSIPIWLDEKLFLKNKIRKGLKKIDNYDSKKMTLLFSGHHLSHAASSFYPSPFKTAAILTIDGVGEWSTSTMSIGSENKINVIKEMHFPHSVGLLYSAFTYYLGFKVNSDEYKIMGLAPFGDISSNTTQDYISKIKSEIVSIKNDGSIWLNQDYFEYTTGLKMIKIRKWERLFDLNKRSQGTTLNQQHCNIALAIQQVTEEIVIKMAIEIKKLTQLDNLCLAGGVALNCKINTKLLELDIFKEIYIQPAAGDAGGALGAALAVFYMYYNNARNLNIEEDPMKGTYLGPKFGDKDIMKLNRAEKTVFKRYDDVTVLIKQIALEISKGKIVGWYQARMEFGPRALGNRSILADPRHPQMQKMVNEKVKFREGFRPFAPSVVYEEATQYFQLKEESPYMLFAPKIKSNLRNELPENFASLSMQERLEYQKSQLPAITHLDFSSRVQTVTKQSNPNFWALLMEFKNITGYPILLNTSFNVRDEPIVCTPSDAYNCFMETDIDLLVINNYLYFKTEQVKS
ncbi:carbamoyltransferase [Mesoflavibacter zeaxanthinifaciens]|uniref:carbamoyltransferase family protein n=1 Tax=Mesoflavibacter zeaxanthinifaciens TaxID=393060 RepID=UPI003A8E4768